MSISANKLKEEGNKSFLKRNFKEAVELYSKAIEKASNVCIFYTNRALCYLKLQQWSNVVEDCRKALQLDPLSVKANFYLGQALLEMGHYDESILYLKRSNDLSKESNENYGDEITRSIRNAKRKRWNSLEEKRIEQEIELQSYVQRLMLEDKNRRIKEIGEAAAVSASESKQCQPSKVDANEIKESVKTIENDHEMKLSELNRLFAENDSRRKKQEIPDYLCGKISFELMSDPVITPSGITYDRRDIEQHLQRVGHFDPITRQELTIDQLIPNLSVKEIIESFIAENEWIDGAL